MPPGVGGHYRPNNNSNPFNVLPPGHSVHSGASHYGHQPSLSGFPSHNLGGSAPPTGFPAPAGHQGGQVSLFGNGLATNGVGNFGGLGGTGATGLASQEAQMSFARGAQLQQQSGHGQDSIGGSISHGPSRIREVWKTNLGQEMAMIRNLIDRYPYVSMDTEFPGVVARPMGNFPSKADYHYQCLRCNVDMLNLIQLGITLFSVDGEVPPAHPDPSLNRTAYANNLVMCPCTWQFNFKFNLNTDMYAQDSIDLLQKAGLDFNKCEEIGIEPREFGSLLITSGLVLDESVSWLSFHSGYDFGYLVKLMSCKQLPSDQEDYIQLVRTWFPRIYDIKYLLRHSQRQNSRGVMGTQPSSIISSLGSRSGLQDLADELGCQREGRPHTAGSDAWLTGMVFWQMRQKIFDNQIPEDLIGMIWGLSGVGPPASAATQAAAIAGHQTPSTNGATPYHTGMTPSTMRGGNEGSATPQTTSSVMSSTPGPGHGYPGAVQGLTTGAFSNFNQYGR